MFFSLSFRLEIWDPAQLSDPPPSTCSWSSVCACTSSPTTRSARSSKKIWKINWYNLNSVKNIYNIIYDFLKTSRHLRVFIITATWSVFAYVWLYCILAPISYGIVESWEGMYIFFQTCSKWSKHVQNYLNLSKLVKTCLKLVKLVLLCLSLYGTLLTEKCISPMSK